MHPFFVGHLGAAIVLGALAGTVVGAFGRLEAAAYGAAFVAGGALVSALISAIGRGYNAPAGRLWLAATLGNPVFLVAILLLGSQWECFARPGFNDRCLLTFVTVLLIVVCCLAPCVGLLARWWSWRRS